jgi:hypothetical protein
LLDAIVTFGDVAVALRLSMMAMWHVELPAPDPGTVKSALHVPLPAVKLDTVDDPEQPVPPQVALEIEDGTVPVYVPLPAIGEPPIVPLARTVKARGNAAVLFPPTIA